PRLRRAGGDRRWGRLPCDSSPPRQSRALLTAAGLRLPRREPTSPLSGGRAAILGLIQGPAELLPISSSAHLALVPWLAGWDLGRVAERSDAGRGSVAGVHAGTGEPAVADGRAAGHPRRGRPQGGPPANPRHEPLVAEGDRRRGRERLRLDAGLAAPDRAGRAQPRPVAVRGLPRGVGGDRSRAGQPRKLVLMPPIRIRCGWSPT